MDAEVMDDETTRLDALRGLALLDSEAEEPYERIVRLATNLFDVPIALVSLVDEHRVWFKTRRGIQATEMRREGSFCSRAIASGSDHPFVVPDALQDPDFATCDAVCGELGIGHP